MATRDDVEALRALVDRRTAPGLRWAGSALFGAYSFDEDEADSSRSWRLFIGVRCRATMEIPAGTP